MSKASLKRHPGLQVFARDHGMGLVFAQRLRNSTRASRQERTQLARELQISCSDVLTVSLLDEQRVLAPLLARTGYAHRFFRHHQRIGDLVARLSKLEKSEDPGVGLVCMLGNALDEYVRWEQNVLFPAIEATLSDEEAAWLLETTQRIEESRCRPKQSLHASVAGATQYAAGYRSPRTQQLKDTIKPGKELKIAVGV